MDLVKEFWALIVALVGFVAWLIRLESSVKSVSDSVARMQVQRHEDLSAQRDQRAEQNKMLDEMRGDIKTLLQRVAK